MQRDFSPTVYMLASHRKGTLYTGVTSHLMGRLHQHRRGTVGGFTAENGVKRLVWLQVHDDIEEAILREKRIKAWKRSWKIELIEKGNPDWRDLAVDLGFDMEPSTRLK